MPEFDLIQHAILASFALPFVCSLALGGVCILWLTLR